LHSFAEQARCANGAARILTATDPFVNKIVLNEAKAA
jgi:hypothetical protein